MIRMTESQIRKYWKEKKKCTLASFYASMSLLGLLALTDHENTGVGGERKRREREREGGIGFSRDFKP